MSVPAVGAVAPTAATPTATGGTSAARAAKAFERVMLEQLTKELSRSAAPDDAAGGASAATTAYRDTLPGAMADALSRSGGIGIAAQLQASMTRQDAAAPVPSTTPSASSAAPSGAAGGTAVPGGVAS